MRVLTDVCVTEFSPEVVSDDALQSDASETSDMSEISKISTISVKSTQSERPHRKLRYTASNLHIEHSYTSHAFFTVASSSSLPSTANVGSIRYTII